MTKHPSRQSRETVRSILRYRRELRQALGEADYRRVIVTLQHGAEHPYADGHTTWRAHRRRHQMDQVRARMQEELANAGALSAQAWNEYAQLMQQPSPQQHHAGPVITAGADACYDAAEE